MHPIPTTGRIVHYFHNDNDNIAAANGADRVPALVVQAFGTRLNLSVFPMNTDATNFLRWSVPHKEELQMGAKTSYWEWPEIAPVVHIEGKSSYPSLLTDGTCGDMTFKKFSDDNRA